ncbi:MAG: T9SS type A sorting domain-containing protein [Candidatus Marinimicrobia bacterium]|nr:T9SS type A sorting domain-containing protein [Candidatus Neomarinimicrobiota bacterium]
MASSPWIHLATFHGNSFGEWADSITVGTDDFNEALPDKLRLYQNYPNPFNPSTVIEYDLPVNSNVSLILYNVVVQEVRELFSGYKERGHHSIFWGGKNNSGVVVASGVYIYRLKAGNYAKSKKLVKLDGGGGSSVIVLPGANPGFRALGKTVGTKQAASDSSFTFVVSADTIETLVENGIELYDGKVLDFYAQLRNRAPALLQLPDQQINEDEPPSGHIFDLWDYASDPDSPDSLLFFSILSQTNPGLANFIINNNRFVDLDSLRADGSGYSDVAVRVTDPEGLNADRTFRFTVNPMTDIRGLLFGVNPDPNGANYTLDSTLVNIAGILDTTSNGGLYHVQIAPTEEVYLQITDPDSAHHPRSIYIPALQDTNLVNHIVENSDNFPELYFHFLNDVFLPQHLNPSPNYTLLKWDIDSLSLWLKNPPDSAYAAYIEQAFSQDVPSFSGGTLKGYNTAVDSASANVGIIWRPYSGPTTPDGATVIHVDPDDPTNIVRVNIYLADFLTTPYIRRSVTLEEALHGVYGCVDTENPDYDQSIFWRWSSGTEMWDGDRKAGTIASKIPRGYRKNQ